jgi:hypothetical protein
MTLTSRDCGSEDVRVLAVIVSELKLGDIERHVLAVDLVERPDDTALEYRPEALNRIRMNRADNVFMCGVIDDFMLRENLVEVFVSNPVVGNQKADFVRDRLAHETGESRSADVLDHTGDNATLATDRTGDDGLARSSAASAVTTAPVMPVLCFAADESFINFDNASEFFKVPVGERSADTVAHVPSSFVGTKTHEPIDLQRAHSLFAGQHQVNDAKPVFERFIRVLENCARNVRETVAGLRGAFVALPMPRVALQLSGVLSATAGAFNALRPSLADQIGAASLFVREMLVELGGGKLVNRLAGSHWSNPPIVGRNVPWANAWILLRQRDRRAERHAAA